MPQRENRYQAKLIKKIKERLPGSMVLKNDPNYIQGIPDLTVLWGNTWAALECKRNGNARHRPNQDHYISKMNEMSFASFIYPENEEEVLDDLERTLQDGRSTRPAKPKQLSLDILRRGETEESLGEQESSRKRNRAAQVRTRLHTTRKKTTEKR